MLKKILFVVALVLVSLQIVGLLFAYCVGVVFANPVHSFSFRTDPYDYSFEVRTPPFRRTVEVLVGWQGKTVNGNIKKDYAARTPVYVIGDCVTDSLYLSADQKDAYTDVSGVYRFVTPGEGVFLESIGTAPTGRYVFMKMTYDYNFPANGEVSIDANPENINYWMKP